jgi:PAS domain-containing protein
MADDAAGPEGAPPLTRTEEILEALGEGFCVFDRDWRLTYANRAAEAKVRESQQRFRAISDSAPDPVSVSGADGRHIPRRRG